MRGLGAGAGDQPGTAGGDQQVPGTHAEDGVQPEGMTTCRSLFRYMYHFKTKYIFKNCRHLVRMITTIK